MRIAARSNSLQCAQEVTCGEHPYSGCHQRNHRNPATLVFEPLTSRLILEFEWLELLIADDGLYNFNQTRN
jgi:hypothetical protein